MPRCCTAHTQVAARPLCLVALTRHPLTSHLLSVRPSSRSFSTPGTSPEAQPQTSFADPDRPDLFYHLWEPPNAASERTPVFALSFLSTPPPSVRSSTVIGWLPAGAQGKEEGAGLNDFVENRVSPPAP